MRESIGVADLAAATPSKATSVLPDLARQYIRISLLVAMPFIPSASPHQIEVFRKAFEAHISFSSGNIVAVAQQIHDAFVSGKVPFQVDRNAIAFDDIRDGQGTDVQKGILAFERISARLAPMLSPNSGNTGASAAASEIAAVLAAPGFLDGDGRAIRDCEGTSERLAGCSPSMAINIAPGIDRDSILVHKTTCWSAPPAGENGRDQGRRIPPLLTVDLAVSFSLDEKKRNKASSSFALRANVEYMQLTSPDAGMREALTTYKPTILQRLKAVLMDIFGAKGIRFEQTSERAYHCVEKTRPAMIAAEEPPHAPASIATAGLPAYGKGHHVVARKAWNQDNGALHLKSDKGNLHRVDAPAQLLLRAQLDGRLPEAVNANRNGVRASEPPLAARMLPLPPDSIVPGAPELARDANKPVDHVSSSAPRDIGPSRKSQTFEDLYVETFHHEPRRTEKIPRVIHRFWAGGAMGEQTMANLKAMAERTKETGWQQILWTSEIVNDSFGNETLKKQLQELAQMGTSICYIEQLERMGKAVGIQDALLDRAATAVKALRDKKDPTGIKYFSDFARLAATYVFGGAYMDTDIGPGTVDLTSSLYHRDEDGEVPLAGVQVQNTQSYGKIVSMPGQTREQNLFTHVKDCGTPVFNYFYATRPGTKSNEAALAEIVNDLEMNGMQTAARHFAGANNPAEWVVPWLTTLAWATSASDINEGVDANDGVRQ